MSQNGWSDDPNLSRISVGTGSTQVRAGDVATILLWVAQQWAAQIEPVETLGGWRSAGANADTGTPITNSNHRSATALDVNGGQHAYEYTHLKMYGHWASTFTPAQVTAMRAIIASTGGVLRWGGDYNSPYRDEMHIEINTTADRVSAFAAKISGATTGGNVTPPPAVTPPAVEEDIVATIADLISVLRSEGVSGAGDTARLISALDAPTRTIVAQETTKVIRSEGVSGAGDVGRLLSALVPAITAALATHPAGTPIDATALAGQIAADLADRLKN